MNSFAQLQWLIKSGEAGYDMYELWNDDKKIVTLSFSPFSQTAKIECANSRRSFKIEKEGFLRNKKTIIKNEYGVKVGQLGLANWFGDGGFIDLNEERFYYSAQNNPLTQLVIYKSSKKYPLITCGIKPNSDDTFMHFEKNKETDKYSCLLMAISWFLFVPVTKENVLEELVN